MFQKTYLLVWRWYLAFLWGLEAIWPDGRLTSYLWLHPFPVGVIEESLYCIRERRHRSVQQHTAKRACRQNNIIISLQINTCKAIFCIHFPYFVASTLLALYLHLRPKTLELVLIISSSFFLDTSCFEFCPIDRVFRFFVDRVLPSTGFCAIDRVLCHRASFVSVLTDERQYLWRVKSNSQIKCSHESMARQMVQK